MEREYLEQIFEAKLEGLKDGVDAKFHALQVELRHMSQDIAEIKRTTLDTNTQAKITNGRVTDLEKWKAEEYGHEKGVSKVVKFMLIVLTTAVGAIVTYLWH